MNQQKHVSVMMKEVLNWLALDKASTEASFVDGTQGGGGHSHSFLSVYPHLKVLGVDRDPFMQEKARNTLNGFTDRTSFFLTWFDDFFEEKKAKGEFFDRILLDLGISTLHYSESLKGFSFLRDDPLDMRLNENEPVSAATLVNGEGEEDLCDLFVRYGEERFAKEIARAICKRREEKLFESSLDFAEVVQSAVPLVNRMGSLHPATRVFQALRIAVNKELYRLERVLPLALDCLKPGGRLAVISFHSLEDRLVKHEFKRHMNDGSIQILTKKPVLPSAEEVLANPPSRSAKLRVVEKRFK